MSYVNTTAHHTQYASRSAGDPRWYDPRLVVAGPGMSGETAISTQRSLAGWDDEDISRADYDDSGDGLGFAFLAALPAITSALATVGAASFAVYQSRKDSKDAKSQAKDAQHAAEEQAAAAQAEAAKANEQRMALLKQQNDAEIEATATTAATVNKFIPVAVVGVLALGGLLIFMRMRSKKR